MVTTEEFFEERTEASKVKHDILRRYLPIFAGALGSTSTGGRVVLVDGYAGPGGYDDDSPGSPLLMADVADGLGDKREIVGVFVEASKRNCQQLRSRLDEKGRDDWWVWEGRVVQRLPEVLEVAADSPTLFFFDPYGLGVPFRALVDFVLARREPTEVLLNFSLSALRRLGGFLDRDFVAEAKDEPTHGLFGPLPGANPEERERQNKRRDSLLERLDEFVGGDWWRGVKRDAEGTDRDWPREVRQAYYDQLNREAGGAWSTVMVSVPRYFEGPAVYDLIMLTRRNYGIWRFNEAVARAHQDLRQRSDPGAGDGLNLLGEKPDEKYVRRVRENVVARLQVESSFRVVDRLPALLDGCVGRALPKHVRAALAELYEQGSIGEPRPKGDLLPNYRVTRGPNAPG